MLCSLVHFLPDGGLIPNYSIEAAHIVSLEIVPVVPPAVEKPPTPKASKLPTEFQDPAILSVFYFCNNRRNNL